MKIKALMFILFLVVYCFPYSHQMQLSATIGVSYDHITGSYYYPIDGTQNVTVQLINLNDDENALVWHEEQLLNINNGAITVVISNNTIDWQEILLHSSIIHSSVE